MKVNVLFFLFLLVLPLRISLFSQAVKHIIDPDYRTSGLEKQGYYLLMDESFEGPLNERRWDRSHIGDENHGCMKNYRHVEERVFVKDGLLYIEVNGEDVEGCDYSGGEIKTFEYTEEGTFRNWWLFPGSYLEIRAKLPMGYGVASAAWLYGDHVNEIDIWEYWDTHPDRYQINYHWGKNYASGDYDSAPHEARIKDESGRDLGLDGQFLTFGLEWDSTYLRHYLNGQLIKSYDLTSPPARRSQRDFPYILPSFLRFNTAAAMRCPKIYLPDSLSKFLELDYVRYYRKKGQRALPVMQLPDILQWHSYGGGGNLSVAYHPNANYRWYAPDFKVADNSDRHCQCERVWLSFGPDLEPGRAYPVILSVDFPSGHREIRRWEVFVER